MTLRVLVLALLLLPALRAQEYAIDTGHSAVIWAAGHLDLGRTWGRFNQFTGSITFDPAAPQDARVEVTVQVASVDSADAKRDEHLRNADFFDAGTFPTITFSAQGFEPIAGAEQRYAVNGELTLRGVTRPLRVEVQRLGMQPHPFTQKPGIGFETRFTINRRDFGVGEGRVDALVGPEVEMIVAIEALAP